MARGDAKMARTLSYYTDFHAILARGPAIYGGLMRQKVLWSGERKGDKQPDSCHFVSALYVIQYPEIQ